MGQVRQDGDMEDMFQTGASHDGNVTCFWTKFKTNEESRAFRTTILHYFRLLCWLRVRNFSKATGRRTRDFSITSDRSSKRNRNLPSRKPFQRVIALWGVPQHLHWVADCPKNSSFLRAHSHLSSSYTAVNSEMREVDVTFECIFVSPPSFQYRPYRLQWLGNRKVSL